MRKTASLVLVLICVVLCCGNTPSTKKDFIKWVDFNASLYVLNEAYKIDVASKGKTPFVDVLAYVTLKNGNNFKQSSDKKILKKMNIDSVRENKYFKHYKQVYTAVVGNYVGEREDGTYGIKAYYPLAKGYWYNDFDDFGNSRSFGFKRRHLGHDLFGGTGTPIIAVEGGTITELGWNRYGGWRIGIRTDDTYRYYYYAHLRKNKPFAEGLEIGSKIQAGDLIGYMGATGYSHKENTNMKSNPHLHFGMQIIFDESQLDDNEIWIDAYNICRFLLKSRQNV